MKIFEPYRPKEVFPSNIKFLKDTDANRRRLTEKFGLAKSGDLWDYSYIEVNTDKNEWRSCFSFEWLYRNQPPLVNIDEI